MSIVKRRIAIFLADLDGGGAQRAMLLFARELVARGMPVDVVVARAGGPLRRLLPPEARVVGLPARGVLAGLPALARYLRATRPDALYSTLAYCNVGALLASRLARRGLPVVVREANVPLSADTASSPGNRVLRGLVRLTYPWAHAVIAVSRDVADELCRVTGRIRHRIAVLPTPVVSDDLLHEAEAPLDHPWFAPDAPPVVVGVGRLVPQKDFPTLLQSFAWLRRFRPLRLVLLGEGPERPALEAQSQRLGIAADVALPGFVDNPFPYLRRAAAFVLSSRYEGMATALLQAMALGTPVVSTDCPGGSHDVLQGGRLGALVPPGNPGALAQAMAAAIGSPRRPDAAAYVRERFGTRAAAERYLRLLPDGADSWTDEPEVAPRGASPAPATGDAVRR
jgi:glycosyltransferase involved in cell wall biosynthesis